MSGLGSFFGSQAASGDISSGLQAGTSAATGLFNQYQPALNPWITGGQGAYANLNSNLGSSTSGLGSLFGGTGGGAANSSSNPFNVNTILQGYQGSPGFNFQVGQANAATSNSAAARGGLLSGNTQTALQSQATNMANTNAMQYTQAQQSGLGSYFSNLLGTGNLMLGSSGQGLSGATSTLNDATSLGTGILNANVQAGIAEGQQTMAGYQGLGSFIGGLGGLVNLGGSGGGGI